MSDLLGQPLPTELPAAPEPAAGRPLPPGMRQYLEQKKQVGEALLLIRMGDFYETFYEDAVTAARVLGIALTSRNKNDDEPIPLAGIPYHALDGYLRKLVEAGLKVAISEQVEDPRLAKGLVKRDIVRIVTPGTLTDESLLDERADNVLAAICVEGGGTGLAAVELASGRFMVWEPLAAGVLDELVRIRPAELLIDDDRKGPAERLAQELAAVTGCAVARRAGHEFSGYAAAQGLHEHFGVTSLEGFGFARITPSLRAAGVILAYLRETQRTSLDHITTLTRYNPSQYVSIDPNSWRALEVERTVRAGGREGSLLAAVDRTVHALGARRLREWICRPLRAAAEIVRRQDAVAALFENDSLRRQVRTLFKSISDVERIAARAALLRVSPRDLAGLGRSLARLPELGNALAAVEVPLLAEVREGLGGQGELADLLSRAIRADAPPVLRDGGVIADGYHPELDRLRALRSDGQAFLAEYQRELVESTGIATLKLGFNKVFGYYIEVPNAQRERVPPQFVRRQTVKNAERYITERLKQYEDEVLGAADRAVELEMGLFEEVRRSVAGKVADLQRAAAALGVLDAVAGLAELAAQRRYVRPRMVPGGALDIQDGRHPVLEQSLGPEFVPNECQLDAAGRRVLIITGPNMSGKSTYIRQVALLTLLAQTGSYVPARAMIFTPVDRIFARVGAFDEIARGQSTFMVEMTEAAVILNTATADSLVVLDEIGRGTSTFDGLALAWAITEHLANRIRCRTLVATHYHELTELADLLEGVHNCSVAVREYAEAEDREGRVVFLHKIVPGRTDQSYGIQVARMAGVPRSVIARSRAILEELDRGFERESHTTRLARSRTRVDPQMRLFADPGEEVLKALQAMDLENLTPLQALQKLHEFRRQADGAAGG